MALKQFLPYLTDDHGRSLVNEGGVVVTKPLPTAQQDSPEGWEANSIEYSRNVEFWGILKSFVTQLKFFKDGALILRDYYYRRGVESIMFFIWLKLDQNFGGGLKHKGWYKGEVDLTTCKDVWDGIEVNITEGGFYKDLNSNKTIPYAYKFSDAETVSCEMDGMDIFYTAKFFPSNGFDVADPNYNLRNHLIDLSTISNEFAKVGTVGPVPRTKVNNVDADIHATSKWFLQATDSGNVSVDYKFTITNTFYTPPALNPAAQWYVVIRVLHSDGSFSNQHVCITKNSAAMIGTFDVAGSATLPVVNGDEIYFYCFLTVTGATGDAQMQFDYSGDDSFFNVSFKFRKPLTVIPAFTVFDLGNKLTKSMSNSISSLSGALLSNDQNLLITSFDGIRGIMSSGVKTSFTDYYKSVDSLKCIAMEVVNNNPIISSRYDKFDTTIISSLGECRKFEENPATDLMYGSVEAGYPPKDLDDVNGKYSFSNTYIWKSPYKRVDHIYDCKSVYIADPFVIEITRINLEGKNTTDNNLDNNLCFLDAEKVYPNYTGDITFTAPQQIKLAGILGLALKAGTRFKVTNGINAKVYTILDAAEVGADTIIHVAQTVSAEVINTTIIFLHYKLRRLPYTSIKGIPNGDTIFNLELSVKRNLANHYRWLRSSFEHMDNKYLTFQKTDKNEDLITTDAAGTIISEKANVLIVTMGPKVFLPHYFEFEVESPYNLRDQMTANSNGYFDFTNNNLGLKGFPVDIKTNDATLETQKYRLLATADNDLTQLIKNR